MDSTCFLVNSNISLILLTCTLQSLINISGKADATLCAGHVYVALEAIIYYSTVSNCAIPASDQVGGSKADMPGYNSSAQCFEAWYAAHLTTCITQSSNDILKVLKLSCSDRGMFKRKNTMITSVMGSLKVCLSMLAIYSHTIVVVEHSSWRESLL